MFIVYSPEGQNRIGADKLKPKLKVDPVSKAPVVSDFPLDETNVTPEQTAKNKKMHEAIHQYQSIKESESRQPIVHIGEIMSSPVMSVLENANLVDAWNMMKEHGIHHLPVVSRQATLVGMISFHEILQRSIVNADGRLEEIKSETVGEWMHKEVITTIPQTDIRKVALVMTQYQVGSLVILNPESQILGIVTLSDLVKRLSEFPPLTIYA